MMKRTITPTLWCARSFTSSRTLCQRVYIPHRSFYLSSRLSVGASKDTLAKLREKEATQDEASSASKEQDYNSSSSTQNPRNRFDEANKSKDRSQQIKSRWDESSKSQDKSEMQDKSRGDQSSKSQDRSQDKSRSDESSMSQDKSRNVNKGGRSDFGASNADTTNQARKDSTFSGQASKDPVRNPSASNIGKEDYAVDPLAKNIEDLPFDPTRSNNNNSSSQSSMRNRSSSSQSNDPTMRNIPPKKEGEDREKKIDPVTKVTGFSSDPLEPSATPQPEPPFFGSGSSSVESSQFTSNEGPYSSSFDTPMMDKNQAQKLERDTKDFNSNRMRNMHTDSSEMNNVRSKNDDTMSRSTSRGSGVDYNEDAKAKAADAVGRAAEMTGRGVRNSAEAVGKTAEKAGRATRKAGRQAEDAMGKEGVKEKVGDAYEKASESASTMSDKAKDLGGKVADKAKDAWEKVKDTVSGNKPSDQQTS